MRDLSAYTLTELCRLSLAAGTYLIFAQLGTISVSDMVGMGVSVPNVAVLKENRFGNSLMFVYKTTNPVDLILHVTINITVAGVAFNGKLDYLQAIKIKL